MIYQVLNWIIWILTGTCSLKLRLSIYNNNIWFLIRLLQCFWLLAVHYLLDRSILQIVGLAGLEHRCSCLSQSIALVRLRSWRLALLIGYEKGIWPSHSIVVFHSCVLKLSYFMELLECDKLLLEVLWVKLIIRVKSENTVVFELPLQEFSDLRCCQLPGSEGFGRLLGCSIELVLLVLNHLYTCLEEPILLGSSDNLLLELRLWLDDF